MLSKVRAKSLGLSLKSTIDGEMGAEEQLALKDSEHVTTRYIVQRQPGTVSRVAATEIHS